ncbi:MAG: hypothetical protein ACUVWO_00380 [Thermodesulfobacteriota bacterium]
MLLPGPLALLVPSHPGVPAVLLVPVALVVLEAPFHLAVPGVPGVPVVLVGIRMSVWAGVGMKLYCRDRSLKNVYLYTYSHPL